MTLNMPVQHSAQPRSDTLGQWVLGGDCAAPDVQRQLHHDLLGHLLQWHCYDDPRVPLDEECLFRLSHSINTLCCCHAMYRRLYNLFETRTFPTFIQSTLADTSYRRARLLRSVCCYALGGDSDMCILLRLEQDAMSPDDQERLLRGGDLGGCLHASYLPDVRSSPTDSTLLGLALGHYGWYLSKYKANWVRPHPLAGYNELKY